MFFLFVLMLLIFFVDALLFVVDLDALLGCYLETAMP